MKGIENNKASCEKSVHRLRATGGRVYVMPPTPFHSLLATSRKCVHASIKSEGDMEEKKKVKRLETKEGWREKC